MNKQAIIETAKEVARIALLAAVTAVVGWVSTKVSSFDPTSVYYIVGTVLLRAVDKYVHVSPDTTKNGITGF